MKKLQSNFTTPEQSKRLLELGVPADSADCYNVIDSPVYNKDEIRLRQNDYEISYSFFNNKHYSPCWSVGRLIEIMKICNHPDDVDQVFCELAYSKKNLIELIVKLMEENKEITDFSKLEE